MVLERINTNPYNEYENKLIQIGKYDISIQCNENVECFPKVNLKNPYLYDKYQFIVFDKGEVVVPMGHKEHFDTDGIGRYLSKETVFRILNYINSPVCMVMGVECL